MRESWSQYAAPVFAGIVLVGVAYLFIADITEDPPCQEEEGRYRAYNEVLGIPEFSVDESRDAYFRSLDRIEARYPDLWQEREWAFQMLANCEVSQPPPEPDERPY